MTETIPPSVLTLLRQKWVEPDGYVAFDIFDHPMQPDRQRDPSYYFIHRGLRSDVAPLTHPEAVALVREGVFGSTAVDDGDCVVINEHSQHALEDFCRDVYAAWNLYQSRLRRVRAACPHPRR